MPIGTAQMAAAAIGAEVIDGVHIEEHPSVKAALADETRQPVLLWPHEAADLETMEFDKPVTLLVVDGTWSLAKKVVRVNPAIAALPRVSFRAARPSEYRIRREPSAECVSTVEAIMYALRAIERDDRTFEEMLEPFRFMVDEQIERQRKVGYGRPKPPPRKKRAFGLPELLGRTEDAVLITADANAWPFRSTERAAEPDELVHWVAVRLSTRESFRAVVKPTRRLCPRTPALVELDEETLASGMSKAAFDEAWRAFVKPSDILVGWGHHPLSFVEDLDDARARFVDLRAATKEWAKERTGTVEDVAFSLGLSPAPLGPGRAGRRLAQLEAVLDFLRGQSTFRRQHERFRSKSALSVELDADGVEPERVGDGEGRAHAAERVDDRRA